MNARLLTAMETEQALANLLSDLKALISGEINETPPLDGVTPLNGSPALCSGEFQVYHGVTAFQHVASLLSAGRPG